MTEKKVKLTVLADSRLERALHAERERLAKRIGLHVSLSAVAARAMRSGLGMPVADGES